MFLNEKRTRYYGKRVGDLVRETFGNRTVWEGEVVELDPMDNNRIQVKKSDGEIKACVAEWCDIVQHVEEWVPSKECSDAVITNDPTGFDDSHKWNQDHYGGYLIAESVPARHINLISAAPDLLKALQQILPHAELIINSNHPDHKAAIAAIQKATK